MHIEQKVGIFAAAIGQSSSWAKQGIKPNSVYSIPAVELYAGSCEQKQPRTTNYAIGHTMDVYFWR